MTNLERLLKRIDSSDERARDFREAARRLADLAEKERTDADRRRGNPGAGPMSDEIRRLNEIADEYEADADCLRDEALETFGPELIEEAIA